ncbi:MAG: hypothetical protein AB1668_01860 [Nanoarchaeota archaeon]
MDWKELFKVSVIVGVIVYLLQVILAFMSSEHVVTSTLLGPLATAFILNKKVKDNWSILTGIIVTFLVTVIIAVLLDTIGIFSV